MIPVLGALLAVATTASDVKPDAVAVQGPVLAFAAGGNAHQAGVAYAVLSHYRRQPAKARPPIALAGVSSGAANALLSAVSWFLPDGKNDRFLPEENPLWNAWRTVSWSGLFPGDASCSEYRARHPEIDALCTDERPYRPHDGIMTINGFEPMRAQILKLFTSGPVFRQKVPPIGLIINLVGETPIKLELQVPGQAGPPRALEVFTSRRYISVKLETDQAGRLKICDWNPDRKDSARRVALPLSRAHQPASDARCAPIAPEVLVDAIVASAALPPLLAPQRLLHCAESCEQAATSETAYCPEEQHLCQSRFVDGAFFDRYPVSDAVHLLPNASGHVLLDSRKPPEPRPASGSGQAPPPLRGVRFYVDSAQKFFDVGFDYELQTLDRYQPGQSQKVSRVHAHSPIFGHYLDHYATLLHRRFAYYDYLTGVYEGVRWSARVQCEELEAQGGPECDRQSELEKVLRFHEEELMYWKAQRANPRIPLRESRAVIFLILDNLSAAYCGKNAPPADESRCRDVTRALNALLGSGEGEPQAARTEAVAELEKLRRYRTILTQEGRPDAENATFSRLAAAFAEEGSLITGDMPFIEDFPGWRDETLRQMGGRLETIERKEGQKGNAFLVALGEYGAMIHRTRVARGWHVGSLSVPSRIDGSRLLAKTVGTLLPYSYEADFLYGGGRMTWDVLSLRSGRPGAPNLTLGAAAHWFRSDAQLVAGPTLMTSWLIPWPLLSEAGARLWWHPAGDDSRTAALAGEVVLRPLYGRLQATLGLQQLTCLGAGGCSPAFYATFGLGDLGSTMYWVVRGLTGD
jgi:hypothetical protein